MSNFKDSKHIGLNADWFCRAWQVTPNIFAIEDEDHGDREVFTFVFRDDRIEDLDSSEEYPLSITGRHHANDIFELLQTCVEVAFRSSTGLTLPEISGYLNTPAPSLTTIGGLTAYTNLIACQEAGDALGITDLIRCQVEHLIRTWIYTTTIIDCGGVKTLLTHLHSEGKLYHCEESAHEIINLESKAPTFTEKEASALDQRMEEAYALKWPEGECPCSLGLELMNFGNLKHPGI
jgi:hypothetical protein